MGDAADDRVAAVGRDLPRRTVHRLGYDHPLLLGAALVASSAHVTAVRAERAAAQHTSYEQWLEQGERNAHSATHYGIYVFKPLSTLALVDPGLDRVTGTATFLESHKRNLLALRPARDSADVWRFADLSAAAILQLLVPLWILLLVFVNVAADRESGTLRSSSASACRRPWSAPAARSERLSPSPTPPPRGIRSRRTSSSSTR